MPKLNFKLTAITLFLALVSLAIVGGWVASKKPLTKVLALANVVIRSPDSGDSFAPGIENVTISWEDIPNANFDVCVIEGASPSFTECWKASSGVSKYSDTSSPLTITMNTKADYDFFIKACNDANGGDCSYASGGFVITSENLEEVWVGTTGITPSASAVTVKTGTGTKISNNCGSTESGGVTYYCHEGEFSSGFYMEVGTNYTVTDWEGGCTDHCGAGHSCDPLVATGVCGGQSFEGGSMTFKVHLSGGGGVVQCKIGTIASSGCNIGGCTWGPTNGGDLNPSNLYYGVTSGNNGTNKCGLRWVESHAQGTCPDKCLGERICFWTNTEDCQEKCAPGYISIPSFENCHAGLCTLVEDSNVTKDPKNQVDCNRVGTTETGIVENFQCTAGAVCGFDGSSKVPTASTNLHPRDNVIIRYDADRTLDSGDTWGNISSSTDSLIFGWDHPYNAFTDKWGDYCQGEAYTVYVCNGIHGCDPCGNPYETNPNNCAGERYLGKRFKRDLNASGSANPSPNLDLDTSGNQINNPSPLGNAYTNARYFLFDGSNPPRGYGDRWDDNFGGVGTLDPSGGPGMKCWTVFTSNESIHVPNLDGFPGGRGVSRSSNECFIYGFLPVQFTLAFEEEFTGTGYVTSHTPSDMSEFLNGYPDNGLYDIDATFYDHRNSIYDTLDDKCGVETTRYDPVAGWIPACVSKYPAGLTMMFVAHPAPGSRFTQWTIGDLWKEDPNYTFAFTPVSTKILTWKGEGFTEYYAQAGFCSESFEGKDCVLPAGKTCGDGVQTNECGDTRPCCHSICPPIPIAPDKRWMEHNYFKIGTPPKCPDTPLYPCRVTTYADNTPQTDNQVEPTKNIILAWDTSPTSVDPICDVEAVPRYQIELSRANGTLLATSPLLETEIDTYPLTGFVAPDGTSLNEAWWKSQRGLSFTWRIIKSNVKGTAPSLPFTFLVNVIPEIHDNPIAGANIGYHYWTNNLKMGALGKDDKNLDSVVIQAWSATGTSWSNWTWRGAELFGSGGYPNGENEMSVITNNIVSSDGIFRQTAYSSDRLEMHSVDRTDSLRLLEKDRSGINANTPAHYWVDTLEPVSYVKSIDGVDRGELAAYVNLRIISGDGTLLEYAAIDRWSPLASSAFCATSVDFIDLDSDPCLGYDQKGNFGNLHASGLYQISANISDPFNFSDTFKPNGSGTANEQREVYDGTSVASRSTPLNTIEEVTPGAIQSVSVTVSAIDKAKNDNAGGAFSESLTIQIRNDYPRVILDSPINLETLSNVDIGSTYMPLTADVEFNTFREPDSPSSPDRIVEIWVAREKSDELTEQYGDFERLCKYKLVENGAVDGASENVDDGDVHLTAKDPAPGVDHSNGLVDYAGTVTCRVTPDDPTPRDIQLLEGYKYKWYAKITNESYTCHSNSTGSIAPGTSNGSDGICQDEDHITTQIFEVLKSARGYIWDATLLTCGSDYTPDRAKSNEILLDDLKSDETFNEIVARHLISPFDSLPSESAANGWEPGNPYPSYIINNIHRSTTIRICTSMPYKNDPAGVHTLRFMPACKNNLSQYLTPCFEVNTTNLIGINDNFTAGPVHLDLGYQAVSSKWFTSIDGNVYAGGSIRFRLPNDSYLGSDIAPYAINGNGVISSAGMLDIMAYGGIDPDQGEIYNRHLTDQPPDQPDNRYYVENIGGGPATNIWPPSYNFVPPTSAEDLDVFDSDEIKDIFKDNDTLDPTKVYKISSDLLNTITDTNTNVDPDPVSFTYNLTGDEGGVVVIYVTGETDLTFSANFRAPDVSSNERILFISEPRIVIAREFNRISSTDPITGGLIWTSTTADNYDADYAADPGINRDTRANIEAGLLSAGGIEFQSMNPDSSNVADNTVIVEGLIATTEGIDFGRDRWETNKLPGHIIKYNLLYLDKLTEQGRENPTSNYNGLYLHDIVWKQQD